MSLSFVSVVGGSSYRRSVASRSLCRVFAEAAATWRLPIVYPEGSSRHHAGRPHPERPERIESIVSRIVSDEQLSSKVEFVEVGREKDEVLEEIGKVRRF